MAICNYGSLILNNGMPMPRFGMGTYPYKQELSATIPAAVNTGYRYFDTSDDYGNEAYLGESLSPFLDCFDDLVVSTKYTKPGDLKNFHRNFEHSRKALFPKHRERPIDLYLLHWPYPNLFVDIWRHMESLYEKGLCRSIGVCNFRICDLKLLAGKSEIVPAVNQVEMHPLLNQSELQKYCEASGIKLICYSPLARMDTRLMSDSRLIDISKKYDKSVVQIVLRWSYQLGHIPIPASAKPERVLSNGDILSFELTGNDMDLIHHMNADLRFRYNPSTFFSHFQKAKFFIRHLQYRLFYEGNGNG